STQVRSEFDLRSALQSAGQTSPEMLDGRKPPFDEQEAGRWFKLATEKADPEAEMILGCMYANGVGVAKDDRNAVLWLRKSAEHGNEKGQLLLGYLLLTGRGVEKNPVAAIDLFKKSAEQGDPY